MIFASDLHLRHDVPIARKDDYQLAQRTKFSAILELAKKYPPLIIAGDVFDKPRPPIPFIRWVMDLLLQYDVAFLCVPGQHDLPSHSLKLLPGSGLGLLEAAGFATILDSNEEDWANNRYVIRGFPFGTQPTKVEDNLFYHDKKLVMVWHHLIIQDKLWPTQQAKTARDLLRDLPQYDYILTGDNHRTFIETTRKRRLINPGSMMRMAIDQQNHIPVVYNVGEDAFIPLPIESNVFDLNLSQDIIEREDRIASFLIHLETGYEISADFERNLESFMKHNQVSPNVREIIRSCLDEN